MYQSKQLGKNRCQFYSQDMQEAARLRVQLEAELREKFQPAEASRDEKADDDGE